MRWKMGINQNKSGILKGTNGMCLFDIVDQIGGDGQYFHLGKASGLLKLANSLMENKRREYFQLNISVSPFSGKWPSKQMYGSKLCF
jgi:hypothetical protein